MICLHLRITLAVYFLTKYLMASYKSVYYVSFTFFSEETSCEFGSSKYYALCGFGGILSCGLTHTAVVPLDLVKCRIQVYIYSI